MRYNTSELTDILDLAWSPDDSLLASGSIDNSIIIWDAKNFPESHYIIKAHDGLVKGVIFDPVGKYLASQVIFWFCKSVAKKIFIWANHLMIEKMFIDIYYLFF